MGERMKVIEVKGTAPLFQVVLLMLVMKTYLVLLLLASVYLHDSGRTELVHPILVELGAGGWLAMVVLIAWTLEMMVPLIWNGIVKRVQKKKEEKDEF